MWIGGAGKVSIFSQAFLAVSGASSMIMSYFGTHAFTS